MKNNINCMTDEELEQELESLDPNIAVMNIEKRKRDILEEQMNRIKLDLRNGEV